MPSLIDLEKKINSELGTKIKELNPFKKTNWTL